MYTFLLTATFVATAAADFQVYAGATNDPVGGGTGNQAYFLPMGVTADCGNLGSPVIMRLDTSTLGGVACDGCSLTAPVNDWDVTRFEVGLFIVFGENLGN